MRRLYPKEFHEFVKAHASEGSIQDMTDRLNEKFNIPVTYSQMKSYFANHGLHSAPRKGRPNYSMRMTTPEMDKFIRRNVKGTGHQAMADMVNKKFGTTFTKDQMKAYYSRNKLNSGLTGRFEKGNESWNKGRPWSEWMSPESQARSRKQCFEHAHIPENTLPLGTIRTTNDGYLIKKVKERGYIWDRWKLVHRMTWEEHNGPIPEGMVVSFKNGDKSDCRIENLILMSQSENKVLNKRHLRSSNPQITEVALAMVKLEQAIRDKKRSKKREQKTDGQEI